MNLSEFKFTAIILGNNTANELKKTLNSIINQTLNFNENIEVIIIDNNTNYVQNIFNNDYAENIKCFESDSPIAANIGLENANGNYLIFLHANDYLSEDTLENALNLIENDKNLDLIALPIYYYKNGRKERYLDYIIDENGIFDLIKNPEHAQILGPSTIIKKESINNIRYLNEYNHHHDLLNEISLNCSRLGICKLGSFFIENIEEKILPTEEIALNDEEYSKFIENNLNRIIKQSESKFKEIPKFVQYELLNQLKWLSAIENSKEELDLAKLKPFVEIIDDNIIMNNILIDNDTKIFLFNLKYGQIPKDLIEKLNLNTVFIDIYDIINNNLHIVASTITVADRNLDLLVNGEKINTSILKFPQYDKYSLGHKYASDYSIEATIPLSDSKKYEILFKSENIHLNIDFSRPCNFSKSIGYAKTKHYISILKENRIIVKRKTALSWIKQELSTQINMIRHHESGFLKALPFRMAYMISYPFLKNKRIWFYMDRPNEPDDNGLHLFKYSVKQDEDIDKYFIIDANNEDFDEIKKIGKVLPYKSLKHRFLGLYVENIISSHPDNEIIYPFWGGYPFFAGLLKSNNIFLQHGILKDNISDWLNIKNMNLSFFLVSSKKEYDSTFKYPYNYEKEVIQLQGLPRYDNLKNVEDKHEIIIMPSWRRYLTRKSNEYIAESEYFKRFNSLINNEKLIEKAREHNYEIIFRPHPNVYNFIELFDENDYVKIDYEKTKFQTLFNNGSLLITDYSSVAFDFAYLYKPVLYYQYGNDYHFDTEKSFFDYESMGMGEICKNEDELVDFIIEYIENDCKIKNKYVKRIDDFFLFNDKNNCKRVHEAIHEVPLKD